MNKFVKGLVDRNNFLAIGNISGHTKGKLAKTRYNNSWSSLKTKFKHKCKERGAYFVEVSEYLTTQRCHMCGSIEGPKGVKELSVRFWECSCGARLDRDVNAAINILITALGISASR